MSNIKHLGDKLKHLNTNNQMKSALLTLSVLILVIFLSGICNAQLGSETNQTEDSSSDISDSWIYPSDSIWDEETVTHNSHGELQTTTHQESTGSLHQVSGTSSHQGSDGSTHQGSDGSIHQESATSSHQESTGSSHQGSDGSIHQVSATSSHQESTGSLHQVSATSLHQESSPSLHGKSSLSTSIHEELASHSTHEQSLLPSISILGKSSRTSAPTTSLSEETEISLGLSSPKAFMKFVTIVVISMIF